MWLATCAAAWPLTPRRTERDEGRSRQDAALCRARNNPAYRRLTASLRHPAPASQPAPPDALAAPVTTEEQIFMTALGRRMAELRKACGLTQTQMAQALEVSQQAVHLGSGTTTHTDFRTACCGTVTFSFAGGAAGRRD